MFRRRRTIYAMLLGVGFVVFAAWYWFLRSPSGDPRLRAFVKARPPVPIVFTSRTDPVSFLPAASSGECFTYPGQPLWQAREGRLRLLRPDGEVLELTWGKRLPDGGTLIDVMSPSVSPDGKRIFFAGRKGGTDPGHFRLYQIDVDGSHLKPLTGTPTDSGCTQVPPMRFGSDGHLLGDAERMRIDYDDLDPIQLPDGRIIFASTRLPDLGRGHARRSTQIWSMNRDGSDRQPLTANRNNDRWPYFVSSYHMIFSLWSRNTEVVTADGRDIQPYDPSKQWLTLPSDSWLGAVLQPTPNGRFGTFVKTPEPVWRPRPLFNGQIVFMTSDSPQEILEGRNLRSLRVVQVPPGLMNHSPSAHRSNLPLPRSDAHKYRSFAPRFQADGKPLCFATPSPCPTNGVLLSGAVIHDSQHDPVPGSFGLYLSKHDWESDEKGSNQGDLQLLFDDPEMVDAEPVAVYPRSHVPLPESAFPKVDQDASLKLANGKVYTGPQGAIHAAGLYVDHGSRHPGQRTDNGDFGIFTSPPMHSLQEFRVYASHRDRFDDPQQPRISGGWELLLKTRVKDQNQIDIFRLTAPSGIPTVLAGFNDSGEVVQWTTPAKDSQGRQGRFLAIAGDHYSGFKPGVTVFCSGCHPGHSGIEHHSHAEKVRE